MTKKVCEISAFSWFYYKETCYDARSHKRILSTACSKTIYKVAPLPNFHKYLHSDTSETEVNTNKCK